MGADLRWMFASKRNRWTSLLKPGMLDEKKNGCSHQRAEGGHLS